MITIFNRKELTITFNMNEQARIRDVLANNGVEYYVKTVNRLSPSPFSSGARGRVGSFGINTAAIYQYIIYVKKGDYEKALHLIKS